MTKKILVEYTPLIYDSALVTEAAKTGNGTVTIKAILQRANAQNQNGRVYTRELLQREVDKYMNEFVRHRGAMGELDHPSDATIAVKNVSHIVTEMHWEGDDLVGTLEILSTPAGNIVKELMKNNIRLGVSSRGMGAVTELSNGVLKVEDDFHLICFDIVSNPSTHGAYLFEGLNVATSIKQAKEDRVSNLISRLFNELSK